MKDNKFPEIVKQMMDHNETLQDLTNILGQKYKSQACRRLSGKVDWTWKDVIILCTHYNTKPEILFRKEE